MLYCYENVIFKQYATVVFLCSIALFMSATYTFDSRCVLCQDFPLM